MSRTKRTGLVRGAGAAVGVAGAGGTPARRADPWVVAALALVSGLGAGLRIVALRNQPMVTFDGTEYVRFSEALAAGHGFRSVFAPGYPALVALARLAIPGRVAPAVAVSLAAGIVLPAIVWALARRRLGERGALLPALACALHLELARHSALTLTESSYMAALYGALAVMSGARHWRRGVLGGMLLGLAWAIRPEAIVSAFVLAVIATINLARRRYDPRVAYAVAAGTALVMAAGVGWYHATLGTWTLSPKLALAHLASPGWRAAEPHLGHAHAHAAGLMEALGPELAAWPHDAILHAQALLWVWPWPLMLLSLWGLARRRGLELAALPYLALLPLLGLSQITRFALPAVPALAIGAAIPVVHERRPRLRVALAACAILGQLACLWALADAYRTPFEGVRSTYRLAGAWLARASEPGDVVEDRKPFVAFYADRPHVLLPDGGYDELLDHLVAGRVRWLVVEEFVARHMRPALAPLLDSAVLRERETRVEMVYARADAGETSLAVFRVLRPGERKSGAPPIVETEGFDPVAGP